MMQIWVAAVALALVTGGAQHAVASPTETGETGLVTIPTTDVLGEWKPSAGVSENGEIGGSQSSDVELHRTQFTLGLGLLPNLELTSQIRYIQFERDVPAHRHTDDIGGLRLGVKYRLLNEADGAPLSAALLGAVVLGTGRDSFPAILDRNSAWGRRETYEVVGIVDKVLMDTGAGDARLTLNAGGLFFDKPESFDVRNQTRQVQRRFVGPNATFQAPFEFAAGLDVPAWGTDNFHIELLEEFRGNTGTIDEVRGSLPTRMFTGVRLAAGNGIALQGGADFGLSGFLDPYRFIASLSYAMPSAAPAAARVALAVPPPPPPPPGPPVKKRIVLRGVNFDFDKAMIRPDSAGILQEAAATLKQNPSATVVVEGHTDAKGTDAYNQRLSMRRATAVRDALGQLGVQADRMALSAKGESQPVAANDNDEGRAQNRRVELLVQP